MTRWQLLELGLGSRAIAYRIKTGRLHRIFPGVYAVGHIPPSPYARATAAVLACGPGAVLSHGSALTLWGVWERWSYPLEVTTSGRSRPSGIRVHHSRTLTEDDIDEHMGVPVTSGARTVFDNAPRLKELQRARAISVLRRKRHLSLDALAAKLDRHPTAHATKLLRPLLAHPDRAPTRSEFEEAFLIFVRRHRLPEPEVNSPVAGYEADIYYPRYQLVVECDGYHFHSDRGAFETDRDRDADRLAVGIATVRVTWDRLHVRSEREAARFRRILALRERELEALRRVRPR